MSPEITGWLSGFAGDASARFWSKIQKVDNGCWVWLAGKNHQGYGKFGLWNGAKVTQIQAHRLAWILSNDKFIPEGMHLDHYVCRIKSCVNPSHVRVCTPEENLKAPDGAAGIQLAKSHCDRGHEYAGRNLRMIGTHRFCRACQNLKQRERRTRGRILHE